MKCLNNCRHSFLPDLAPHRCQHPKKFNLSGEWIQINIDYDQEICELFEPVRTAKDDLADIRELIKIAICSQDREALCTKRTAANNFVVNGYDCWKCAELKLELLYQCLHEIEKKILEKVSN